MSKLSQVATRDITQLVAAGSSAWNLIGKFNPVSAGVVVTVVNGSALIARVEYSDDGDGAANVIGEATPAITDAGTVIYALDLKVLADYPYYRITWVSGTADSVDAQYNHNLLN